jgi:TetR/AcrR family transcriptional regulator, transcriptional repressor for nem operon
MGPRGDTKERLILSAIDLMHGRSYANVGVQELCDQAGVKKGSFYHFFPSKRDLTLAAVDQECETLRREIWSKAFAKEVAPLKRIERYLEMSYRSQRDYWEATGSVRGCPFGNLAVELGTQDEMIRDRIDRAFKQSIAVLEETLNDAFKAGEIPNINVRRTAQAILAYLEGMILVAKTRNDPEVIRELSPSVFQLCGSTRGQAQVG